MLITWKKAIKRKRDRKKVRRRKEMKKIIRSISSYPAIKKSQHSL